MFAKILQWLRERLAKMLNLNAVKQSINVDVAISPEMVTALQTWSSIYINSSPWLTGELKSLNLGAAIAAELARAVTIEMEIKLSGSPRADFLQAQLWPVLKEIRTYTEYAVAKGGLMLKPYISNDGLAIDAVHADMFYPIAFDSNGNMTSCVFADQKTISGNFYTRLEAHVFALGKYQITNTAWKSSARDMLGSQIPLTDVSDWADLLPDATIMNVKKPLFAYFKMPFANNIDPRSPLGVSAYARAAQGDNPLMRQADQMWTDLLWEFESGKRAVYTTPDAFGKDTNGKAILPDKRLYRLLDLAAVQLDKPGFFHDWTPTFREANILNGLDAVLRRIEFNCGLSYGVLSNPEAVALTATEIKSSHQRYYSTVTDVQKELEDAFNDLLYAMDVWCTLGRLAPLGTYSVSYDFDDSVITDHDVQFQQDLQALDRVMSRIEFRMRNYSEDEPTAKKMIAMVDAEKPEPTSFFPETE